MIENKRGFGVASAALGLGVGLLLSGCGDDAPPPARSSSKEPVSVLNQPHTPVTESEHQIFERKYTEKCIKSQQKSGESGFTDDQALGAICACMAKEISQRLTHADAVHFNERNEFPFELVMMTDAAANDCLSKNR